MEGVLALLIPAGLTESLSVAVTEKAKAMLSQFDVVDTYDPVCQIWLLTCMYGIRSVCVYIITIGNLETMYD